jgi:hypothetical protein
VHLGRFWPAQSGWAASPRAKQGRRCHGTGRRRLWSIPVNRRRGRWGNRSRRRPARGGARFRGWSGEKLTERAPWWWEGDCRRTIWRASFGGGGAWLMARREVRSTGGARGGVGRAVPWPEVPVCVEALLGDNSGAGWLAVGSEQRTTVQGGAWRQWEAHRLRGGPGRW